MDCRTGQVSARYSIGADIEALAWDPFSSFHLYCAMEDGMVSFAAVVVVVVVVFLFCFFSSFKHLLPASTSFSITSPSPSCISFRFFRLVVSMFDTLMQKHFHFKPTTPLCRV